MAQTRESNLAALGDSSVANAGPYLRVKLISQGSDGTWTVGVCGAGELGVGVIDNQEIFAAASPVNVNLNNDNKSKIYQVSGAITAGATVFAAAGGLIAATGTLVVGTALQAASGSGSYIEVLPSSGSGTGVAPSALTGSTDAIPPHQRGNYVVTTAGVDAMTLAAPTSTTDDGLRITVVSNTANAHTITATGLLQTGGSTVNVATFAAHPGASLELQAYQGKWQVISANAITFS